MKPYSEACEKNREPILAVLREQFAATERVLEIASGTGQHAVYFARELPHLCWQTSDLAIHHAGIQAWLDKAQLDNVLPPLLLDVTAAHWPVSRFDGIFNANTVHIISWPEVEQLFTHIARIIEVGGKLCLYGPFNYQGRYTSESNARFDAWLKGRNKDSGIRDFEAIEALAARNRLVLLQDVALPANNRMLIWQMSDRPSGSTVACV